MSLAGRVALVAGATRGAGRGIAVAARRRRRHRLLHRPHHAAQRSEMDRPETIEETAALVDAAGGARHRRAGRPPRARRGPRPRRPHRRRAGRPPRARQRHLGRDDDGVGQDGVGVDARPRAAHAAPGRRHPRHHEPLRAPAADQDARADSSSRSPTGPPSTTRRTTGSRSSTTSPRRPTCAWRSPSPTSWRRTARRRSRSRRAGCARRRCSRRSASPRRTGATQRRAVAALRDLREPGVRRPRRRRARRRPRRRPLERAVALERAAGAGLRLHRRRRQPARRVALRRRGPGRRQARRHDRLPMNLDVPAEIVAELRSICLGLPEAREEQAWVGTRWRIRNEDVRPCAGRRRRAGRRPTPRRPDPTARSS